MLYKIYAYEFGVMTYRGMVELDLDQPPFYRDCMIVMENHKIVILTLSMEVLHG